MSIKQTLNSYFILFLRHNNQAFKERCLPFIEGYKSTTPNLADLGGGVFKKRDPWLSRYLLLNNTLVVNFFNCFLVLSAVFGLLSVHLDVNDFASGLSQLLSKSSKLSVLVFSTLSTLLLLLRYFCFALVLYTFAEVFNVAMKQVKQTVLAKRLCVALLHSTQHFFHSGLREHSEVDLQLRITLS